MNAQINGLKKNNTFDVVNKPIGQNIVGSKWVFKTKKNAEGTLERFRARAIAQGFLNHLASTVKTPLPQLFGMNHSDY